MSFADGNQRIATSADCSAPWAGGKYGKHFRCAFCGHRFAPGDKWRWQCTNDMPAAPGNPLVCEACDDPEDPGTVRQRWAERWAEYRANRFCGFRKQNRG